MGRAAPSRWSWVYKKIGWARHGERASKQTSSMASVLA